MKNLVFILLIVLLFAGCKPCNEVSTTVYNTDTMVIYHDSIVMLPADSSLVNALFQCDSLNNVVLTELETIKGRKVKPIVEFKDRWFHVFVPVDSEAVVLRWKEKHTSNVKNEVIVRTEVKKYVPNWVRILASMGAISILFLLALIVIKVYRIIKPI
jgi:Ni/Fe-hydrogenase subunit HybB-like protein